MSRIRDFHIKVAMIDADEKHLESKRARTERFATGGDDFFEALEMGRALVNVIDDQSGTRMIAMEADQCVPAIGDQQRILEGVEVGR